MQRTAIRNVAQCKRWTRPAESVRLDEMASVDDTIDALARNRTRLDAGLLDVLELLEHLRTISAIDRADRQRLSIAIIRTEVFADYENPALDNELGNLIP